ncbi:MAG TPA: zinc ribbon domain-containing protein [Verrucomicrobiales bacterium]|nr:zinc ribbon domain-containing protein [Verrucomicrobiales bacterium]HIL71133.1 zinc ribbon domain-containing protein [Verrucomicrobiota bacterium]
MPTYEYICQKCGFEFEEFQSMSADVLTVCPKPVCPKSKTRWGKGTVKRQIGTGAGVIFKGSGFYETDYRSSNYNEAAKKDKEAQTKSSEKKSDSKKKDSKGKSSSSKKAKKSTN